ncbi:MAG TPA: quinone-dependent dihydroorotate dehydrogenase [Trueperaceae bacterium]
MNLYRRVRPALFRLDAERAHELTLRALELASRSRLALRALHAAYGAGARAAGSGVEAFGLRFPNRVGLAAGLDKNGVAVPALAALGFGFIEVGTVTAVPQPGNERPRLFRLVEDEALINRMGFNNQGAAALARRVAEAKRAHGDWLPPIGVNVGKSRVAAPEEAPADYRASLAAVWDVADYLAVNVSSPNTPGLRDLQATGPLRAVLTEAQAVAEDRGAKPVLVKLSPDLSADALREAARVAEGEGAAGLIATNTTVSRPGLKSEHASEAGGLSGRPLAPLSLAALRALTHATSLPIVSVGGIFSAEDVSERLAAGATLVQVYTSFVFSGPGSPSSLASAC